MFDLPRKLPAAGSSRPKTMCTAGEIWLCVTA